MSDKTVEVAMLVMLEICKSVDCKSVEYHSVRCGECPFNENIKENVQTFIERVVQPMVKSGQQVINKLKQGK